MAPHRTITLALLVAASTGCQTLTKLALAPATAAASGRVDGAAPLAAAAPPAVAPAANDLPASAAGSRPLGPFPQLDEQQALERVLPALQQLAKTDPSLHSEVLQQLASTEPSLWQLTVDRAASTGRLKQQIARRAAPGGATTQLADASQQAIPLHQSQQPIRLADRSAGATPLPTPPAPPAATPAPTQPQSAISTDASSLASPGPQVIENRHATAAPSTIRLVSADTTTDPAAAAPSPAAARPMGDWRSNLDAAITALEADVTDSPRSTSEAYRHARLRLLRLAAGDRDGAVAPPPGLSTTEQSFWSKQLFALSTLLDGVSQRDLGGRAAAAGRHQADASASLRQLGDLEIRNLAFCEQVYGFGAYEAIDEPRFTAGQSVTLYAEVENYRSESTADGYRTSLATSYRVEDRHGTLVDSGEFPVVEDLCLSRRRDFHIQYTVTLPTTVYAGEYVVKLAITDQLGDKIGDNTIDFEIVGD